MASKIFLNLPVKNLDNTKEFFSKLGFTYNEQFTNENAACMIVSEDIFIMLLMEEFFRTFTQKEICDAKKSTEVIVALSAESREKVDEMVNAAVAAGGTAIPNKQDHGFMYTWGFEDLDGHAWEMVWMDPAAVQAA